jgi:hypothetical protein
MASMFDIFDESHTDTYTYLGKSVDITITPLTLIDAIKLTEGTQDDKFKVILNSIKKNHPDETLATVKAMPMAIANKLMVNIFRYNDIPIPENAEILGTPPNE